MAAGRFEKYCHVMLLLLVIALIYSRTLAFGYVWDDADLFVNSTRFRDVRALQDWWSAVSSPVLPMTTYFRPLVLSTFVVQFSLFGIDPFIAHLINVLIFAVNGVLVYILSLQIFKRFERDLFGLTGSGWSMLSALWYVMHPAQIESVVWVSGRFDLMVTLFALLNLLGATCLVGVRAYAVFCLTLFFALLSKEMAITLILISPSLRWVIRGVSLDIVRREAVGYFFSGGLALGGYLALKWYGMAGHMIHWDVNIAGELTALQRVAFVGWTLGFYLKMFIWPFSDISPSHSFDPTQMTFFQLGFGVFVLMACLCVVGVVIFRRSSAIMLLMLALITLAPVSNIVLLTIGGEIGCDRFMAFPLTLLMPATLVLVNIAFKVLGGYGKVGRYVVCLPSVWLVVAGLNLWVTVPLWRSDLSMWMWVNSKAPENFRGQLNLASAYYRLQDYRSMELLIEKSLKLGGDPRRFDLILGAARIRQGREAEGVDLIEHVLAGASLPHKTIQHFQGGLRQFNADTRWYAQSKQWAFSYLALSEGYRGLGRFAEALEAADVAVFYQSDLIIAGMDRAFALYALDRWDEAEKAYADTYHVLTPDDQKKAAQTRTQFMRWLCERYFDRARSVCVRSGLQVS